MSSASDLTVLADAEALARYAADWLTARAETAGTRFSLALSGGSTPKRLYELLAARERFPWSRTHLFWGDERLVPLDHPDSNYRMVETALLRHVPIPPAHIHPMPTDGAPADAARRYQQTLEAYYGGTELRADKPLFDVVLLGLGDNGHTASLFPGTPSLEEDRAWVAAVTTSVPQPRLTLTYPAIAMSGAAVFLVAGAGKREVLRRVRAGERELPAARVTSIGGVRFFADHAAAG